jgi:NDP-sugar pyrophosphorylase family protein
MKDVLGIIMGGGKGTRLHPLTKMRSKPAVPIAGKYRLIDIPISNCINSGINRVAILTQFNSVSLHRHISQAYNFDVFHTGWVDILAAEQTPERADWYQGTADAVRKQLFEIQASGAEFVLILAGDHLYRMDYREMTEFLWEKGADIAVAVHLHQPDVIESVITAGLVSCSTIGQGNSAQNETSVACLLQVLQPICARAAIGAIPNRYSISASAHDPKIICSVERAGFVSARRGQ